MCHTDLFFSYRREKNVQGKVGRLMSVIGRGTGEKGNRGKGKKARTGKRLQYFLFTLFPFPSSPVHRPSYSTFNQSLTSLVCGGKQVSSLQLWNFRRALSSTELPE